MPRMKNAVKLSSKSSDKTLATFQNIGFTTKHNLTVEPLEGAQVPVTDDQTSKPVKGHPCKSLIMPIETDNPELIGISEEPCSVPNTANELFTDNDNMAMTYTVKKEKLIEPDDTITQDDTIIPDVITQDDEITDSCQDFNGGVDKSPEKELSVRKAELKYTYKSSKSKSTENAVESVGKSFDTSSHKVGTEYQLSQLADPNVLSGSPVVHHLKKTFFIPPPQSRSQRLITPSKRVLEDIVDRTEPLTLKIKRNSDKNPPLSDAITLDKTDEFLISPTNAEQIRSKRPRKPSQKILMMLENERDMSQQIASSGISSGAKATVKIRYGTDKINTVDANSCYGCYDENTKLSRYFNHAYCNHCVYIWKKFLRKKEIPRCKSDCNKSSPYKCGGCRSILLNASLPLQKRVKMDPSDDRLSLLEMAVEYKSKGAIPPIFGLGSRKIAENPLNNNEGQSLQAEYQAGSTAISSLAIKSSPSGTTGTIKPNIETSSNSFQQVSRAGHTITAVTSDGKLVKINMPKDSFIVSSSPKKSTVYQATKQSLVTHSPGYSPLPCSLSRNVPESSGPRVKHVSRSAFVAQGEPAIIQPVSLRLSALPPDEKCKIWNKNQSLMEEDNELGKSIQQNFIKPDEHWIGEDSDLVPHPKKGKIKTKLSKSGIDGGDKKRNRKNRCGHCTGCRTTNCRQCMFCLDMTKYGGPGKMKQCCQARRCENRESSRFDAGIEEDDGDGLFIEDQISPAAMEKNTSAVVKGKNVTARGEKKKGRGGKQRQPDTASSLGDESVGTADENDMLVDGDDDDLVGRELTNKPLTELLRVSARYKNHNNYRSSEPDEMALMTSDGTLITNQNPGFSLVESLHRIMADFIDTYDIDKVWQQGMAIVASSPQPVRVLCYLCGSAGHHEFVYCCVCCEPFHDFCLEDTERPKAIESKDWICKKCKFCQVCGKLNDLLTCNKCGKAYHAECLGGGYVVQPTSSGIWVCNSCVKCTSCGATTPGGPDDKWSSDFSLCATCEQLKLKGNYCPMCGLCYSDDDWDCKMIGCSKCESWTHAKCENLPDDLYELIGYIGDEEAQYVCKNCRGDDNMVDGKPEWLVALESLRVNGFKIIVASICDKKYAQPVARINRDELKSFYDKHQYELQFPRKDPIQTTNKEFSATEKISSPPLAVGTEQMSEDHVTDLSSAETEQMPVPSQDSTTEQNTQGTEQIPVPCQDPATEQNTQGTEQIPVPCQGQNGVEKEQIPAINPDHLPDLTSAGIEQISVPVEERITEGNSVCREQSPVINQDHVTNVASLETEKIPMISQEPATDLTSTEQEHMADETSLIGQNSVNEESTLSTEMMEVGNSDRMDEHKESLGDTPGIETDYVCNGDGIEKLEHDDSPGEDNKCVAVTVDPCLETPETTAASLDQNYHDSSDDSDENEVPTPRETRSMRLIKQDSNTVDKKVKVESPKSPKKKRGRQKKIVEIEENLNQEIKQSSTQETSENVDREVQNNQVQEAPSLFKKKRGRPRKIPVAEIEVDPVVETPEHVDQEVQETSEQEILSPTRKKRGRARRIPAVEIEGDPIPETHRNVDRIVKETPVQEVQSPSKKKRGRPKMIPVVKIERDDENVDQEVQETSEQEIQSPTRKKRGRARRIPAVQMKGDPIPETHRNVDQILKETRVEKILSPTKKKRGRPKMIPEVKIEKNRSQDIHEEVQVTSIEEVEEVPRRKPGRKPGWNLVRKLEVKPGRKPGRKPGPKPGLKLRLKPGPKPGLKRGRKPGPKPGLKSGPKPGLKSGLRSKLKPGPKPGAKLKLKSGPKPALKSGPKSGSKPGPKPGRKRKFDISYKTSDTENNSAVPSAEAPADSPDLASSPVSRTSRRSITHSTPVCEEPKIQSKKRGRKPGFVVKKRDSSPLLRRSGRDKSQFKTELEPKVEPAEVVKSVMMVDVSADKKPYSLKTSLNSSTENAEQNISSSSLPESFIGLPDPVDLSIRFKDVEWIHPVVSYESLVEGNQPVDISSVGDRVESYTSVNDFIDDVVRILQSAMTRSKLQNSKVYKQLLGVKKLFELEISKLFPWCEVHKSPFWEHNMCQPKGMLEIAHLPPNSEHTYAMWLQKENNESTSITQPSPYKMTPQKSMAVNLPSTIQDVVLPLEIKDVLASSNSSLCLISTKLDQILPSLASFDDRKCQFCTLEGDDHPNECGRLIYAGADDWVHINCALWSAEVFEEVDGTLQQVHSAIGRGKSLECNLCSKKGATVGCCASNCLANFHFKCAKLAGCAFMTDKQVFCAKCRNAVDADQVLDANSFSVLRTVTVDFAHVKMKKPWQRGFKSGQLTIVAGAMTIETLGYIIPESDYLNVLVPVDYCVSRVFWSTKNPYQRCIYTCKVVRRDTNSIIEPQEITIPDVTVCHDPDLPGYTSPSMLSSKYPDIFPPDKFDFLKEAQSLDADDLQVTDNSTSFNLSQSWPIQSNSACYKEPDHRLYSSYPNGALSGLSEKTKRLLGPVSPRKLKPQGIRQSHDADLANLTGIAAALNRAAYRSNRKRRRKALKNATVMYGSAAPEVSGNIDDDVAEILDLVETDGLSEDELEEKDVIILRDVDEKIAAEVVDVIGSISQEEADKKGGVLNIMQSILDRHRSSSIQKSSTSGKSLSENLKSSTTQLSDTTNPQHTAKKNQEVSSDCHSKVANTNKPFNDNYEENESTKDELSDIKIGRSGKANELNYPSNRRNEEDNSTKEMMDVEASNYTPSKNCALKQTMSEQSPAQEKPKSEHLALKQQVSKQSDKSSLDCSPPEQLDELPQSRPHSAVSLTSSASSFQAYSSASSAENSPNDMEVDETPATADNGMGSSPAPLLSPPKIVITDFSSDHPTEVMEVDPFQGVQQLTKAVSHGTKDRLKSLVRKRSESLSEVNDKVEYTANQKRRASLGDSTALPSLPQLLQSSHASHVISSCLPESAAEDSENSKVEEVTKVTFIDNDSKENGILSQTSYTKEIISEVACDKRALSREPSPPLQDIINAERPPRRRRKRKYKGARPKTKFSNDMCNTDMDVEIDSCIVLRDRTPVTSGTDSDESDQCEPERIVAPPGVNCVVKDLDIVHNLPTILNAMVKVEKLPPDSDAESISDTEAPAPDYESALVQVPSPPARDISREIRKDMINYCEDSGSSSSTDEEDLVKPRALRQRNNKVDYNENKKSDVDSDSDKKHKKKLPRPTAGKIVVDKDGSIRGKSENIPSELQKTISDAIRKARNKENYTGGMYAGAGPTGLYKMIPSKGGYQNQQAAKGATDRRMVDVSKQPKLKSKAQILSKQLGGDNCQLAFMSSKAVQSTLPVPVTEEEIRGENSRGQSETQSNNSSKPSTVFLNFLIESDDGFQCKADNWSDAWRSVTDAVRDIRISSGCPAVSFAGVNGLHMLGLEHSSITYLTEQLYGARYCHNYRFKFHKPPLFEYEDDLPETASGCYRSEPYVSRHKPDMFSFLDSRYRKRPVVSSLPDGRKKNELTQPASRRATSMDLPMGMRYRHLKANAKEAAAVYRSGIHGRGLFCTRRIDSGEMVIEYAGEVIRHTLCDKREKYYERKGIGCYMFRIDDNLVVDATMKGNAARFINHSCDPNCFSKVIDVNGQKHIVIFASRTIQRGEELTYDYKFPFEEIKIPCSCASKKCRGYLN